MGNTAIPTTGGQSDNDWFACVRSEHCGHIGVHPNGIDEFCPTCGSGLERYIGGRIWKCDDCETEYVAKGDAEDCC